MKSPQLLLLFLIAIVVTGCGDGHPRPVPVSGQVLIDGKPLTYGVVTFIPKGHRASRGMIDKDGHFTLSCYGENDGAMPGTHKIEVSASETVKPTLIRWHAPKKYQDQTTSSLTQDITGPMDDAVINLTWDGGQPFDEAYYPPNSEYKK